MRHWAEGGETSAHNTHMLCDRCHYLVHEGGFTVEGEAPGGLVFRDPDGRALRACGVPPALPDDPVADLMSPDRGVVRDAPPWLDSVPTTCFNNAGCALDQYCALDGSCIVTGAKAGTCTPRPAPCPDLGAKCSDVCGCDGNTYCSRCEAHEVGVSVAHDGPCLAPTCNGLDTAYVAEVKIAKQCCPTCKSIQCVTKVADQLACPCDTYVNTGTSAMMQALKAEWISRGCQFGVACPAISCPAVFSASCIGRGTSGSCEDN